MTGIIAGLMKGIASVATLPRNDNEKRDWDEVVAQMISSNRAAANNVSVTPESSLQMGAVFAAAGLLADTIGSLPLILYERQDKIRRRATEHDLYPLLHDAPNEMMTAVEYRSTMQGYLALRGNAISQVVSDGAGRITELWPLRWEAVQQMKVDKESGRVFYYYMNPDASMQWLDSNTIWHLRGWGSDGLVGHSPISLARRTVELGLSAEEFGARFFKNDARPGVVLEHPGSLSALAQENLKKSWEETHQGVSKSHRVAILEEGLKLHEIGIPPEDAQFLQTRQFSVTEIARWFRVPPHMIGDLERATFSNIEHQGIEFVTYSLQSWLTRWEQSIKKHLLTESDRKSYYVEHLVDALLRGDTQSRYTSYQSGIQAGWLTRADAREKENLEPIEGLEKPLVPLNMVEEGEEPPAQPAPQEKPGSADNADGADNTITPPSPVNGRGVEGRGETRAVKGARGRHRLMRSYRRMFEDTAKRVLRREVQDVRKAGEKLLRPAKNEIASPPTAARNDTRAGDQAGFRQWLETFYSEHKDWMWKQLKPLYDSYCDLVANAAEDEVGFKAEVKSLEAFVNSYLASYTGRHAGTSQNKIQQALQKAIAEDKGMLEALTDELDTWVDDRGSQIADEESVRANNAMAVAVYGMAGVLKLMSVAFGESCPYCKNLDGQTIGIDSYFIQAGKDFQPEGAERPLTSADNLKHAPYHGGCDCMTVAA